MKLTAAIALIGAAFILSATTSTAGAAQNAPHRLHGIIPRIARANQSAAPKRTARSAGFNCIAACSAYESKINQYFTDVSAANGATDNVYSVATQYHDSNNTSIQSNETFAGSYVDGNEFPTSNTCDDFYDKYCITDQALQTEIGKAIAKNHWPAQSSTTLYFIFTPASVGVCELPGVPSVSSNPCSTDVFCAYHSATSSFPDAPNSFLYAVEPDGAAAKGSAQGYGCATGESPVGSGVDDTLSTVSHEQIEAITDPTGLGWYVGSALHPGPEIGDLCAYDFGSTPLGGAAGAEYNQVINGHNYWLQLEYSNQDSGCVPYLGGPVTAPDPRDGVGPLAYQNGAVMTTNTIYAIYWVPAPPANKQLPAITGVAKVGKKLTASHGTWSNVPKFAYRWLRCSAAGTSCTGIAKATGSSYTLVKADAHHTLEVRVTAKNEAGRANAISAPSRVVKR